jgi:TatD DNase family protein
MKFYNLHTHTATQQENSVELVNQYPQDFDATIPVYSIGIHPWFIVEERLASDLDIVETKLQEPIVSRLNADWINALQFRSNCNSWFSKTVGHKKYNKPVVLHCVASFDELYNKEK